MLYYEGPSPRARQFCLSAASRESRACLVGCSRVGGCAPYSQTARSWLEINGAASGELRDGGVRQAFNGLVE